MVKYDPKSWVSLIFDVYSQHLLRVLFPLLGFICSITLVQTFLLKDYWKVVSHIHGLSGFHSLLGVVLGLFLVLRTNTAYDRWWEGRKIWGSLVNDSRSYAMKLACMLKRTEDKKFFRFSISNFAFALKEHLRAGVKPDELQYEDDAQRNALKNVQHKPNYIAMQMYKRLKARYEDKTISGEEFIILDKETKAFVTYLGMCERIKKTPIPYSYSMYIKKFIFIYSLTLPFSFIPHIGYWSVLPVSLIFYILVSVELIAEEIEDPFGLDINDLPLQGFCQVIRRDVDEILPLTPDKEQQLAS